MPLHYLCFDSGGGKALPYLELGKVKFGLACIIRYKTLKRITGTLAKSFYFITRVFHEYWGPFTEF